MELSFIPDSLTPEFPHLTLALKWQALRSCMKQPLHNHESHSSKVVYVIAGFELFFLRFKNSRVMNNFLSLLAPPMITHWFHQALTVSLPSGKHRVQGHGAAAMNQRGLCPRGVPVRGCQRDSDRKHHREQTDENSVAFAGC